MYKKELKYTVIEYSDKDLAYIDSLCEYIEKSGDEIVSFFDIQQFGEKVSIKLWDNLENFRSFYKQQLLNSDENGEVLGWLCGFANENKVHTLTLEEYRKTEAREDNTLQDLEYLVMHEFTHSCHYKINNSCCFWLREGLATTLSHQYDNADRVFNFTLEQAIAGGRDNRNNHTMFSHVYETYGRDYILDLVKDNRLLEAETPRIYEETKAIYGHNKSK